MTTNRRQPPRLQAGFDWLMNRRARQLTDRLAAWIPPGSRVADLGSGTGHNAREWARRLNAAVDEFDVSDMHWIGPGPILFDGRAIPALDECYTVVIALFVMQYSHDPAILMREARRISAGRIIVIQSTYQGIWGKICLKIREFIWGPLAYSIARLAGMMRGQSCPLRSQRHYSRSELKGLFQQTGLTIRHWDSQEWWGLSISRDLYVLDVQPQLPTSRSSSRLAMKADG